MEQDRLAPLVGILGCLGVVGALLYPYLVAGGGVDAYYSFGTVNPLVSGLLALVTIIVLAAGRENRTDPPLAAGAGLVLGLFAFGIGLLWATSAPLDAVQITPQHRWSVAGTAGIVVVGAAWYAWSLELF